MTRRCWINLRENQRKCDRVLQMVWVCVYVVHVPFVKWEQKQTNYGWADMVFGECTLHKVHEKCDDGLMLTLLVLLVLLFTYSIVRSFVRSTTSNTLSVALAYTRHLDTYTIFHLAFATCMHNVKSANIITCNNFSFFLILLASRKLQNPE